MKIFIWIALVCFLSSCEILTDEKKGEKSLKEEQSVQELWEQTMRESNIHIAQKNGYYYQEFIAEEKEFSFHNTLEKNNLIPQGISQIHKEYINGERPICPGMPNKESCMKEGYGVIYRSYVLGDDRYDLIFDAKNQALQNKNRYFILKNDEPIFQDYIEMVGAWSPYKAYTYNDMFLFVYTKNKGEDQVLYNIFYDGEYLNKEYGFEDIDEFFIYKGKQWFIVDKTKIFFNGKLLPYTFDYIQNQACCTTPSLFQIYENGKMIFANRRGSGFENVEYDIIELDLNDYISW